jgi:hypothetical protein
VKLRTALKNRVNNLLASKGVLLKKESLSSEKGLQEVLKADLDATWHLEMEVLVEQIRHLNESISKFEGAIRDQGPKPGWESITSIGPVGGTALLAVIGKVDDFADEGKLAAYFGIVPRVSDSNGVHKRGHHEAGEQTRENGLDPVRPDCQPLQRVPQGVLPASSTKARYGEGDRRPGKEIPRHHLQDAQERLDIRGLPPVYPDKSGLRA